MEGLVIKYNLQEKMDFGWEVNKKAKMVRKLKGTMKKSREMGPDFYQNVRITRF